MTKENKPSLLLCNSTLAKKVLEDAPEMNPYLVIWEGVPDEEAIVVSYKDFMTLLAEHAKFYSKREKEE